MTASFPATSGASTETTGQPVRVIGLFPDLLGIGGVQEAGRLTATALRAIVSQRGGTTAFLSLNDAPGPSAFDFEGSPVPLEGFGRAKARFALSTLGRAVRTKEHGPQIVIAAHPHLAVPASLMQRISPGLKIIVMAHGIEVWSALSASRRRALQRANVVLAPSSYTAEKLSEVQGVAGENIRVVPWPVNPEFARMASEPAALPLPADFPRGRIVLTVGRWMASERYKGADDLIRAVALLKAKYRDLHMVAVGGGDDVPRLTDLARSLGVADSVRFFFGLTRSQIAACYCRADIFALPSTGEGFGLVFLEAMAFARPVIGAASGGAPDLIQDGVNGTLVAPHDVPKLAEAIEALLGDDSLRLRMGRDGADLARRKYCFGRFKHDLENILDDLISGAGG
jgi:phosphatidyl-myo-inositol dimannoside synthase